MTLLDHRADARRVKKINCNANRINSGNFNNNIIIIIIIIIIIETRLHDTIGTNSKISMRTR